MVGSYASKLYHFSGVYRLTPYIYTDLLIILRTQDATSLSPLSVYFKSVYVWCYSIYTWKMTYFPSLFPFPPNCCTLLIGFLTACKRLWRLSVSAGLLDLKNPDLYYLNLCKKNSFVPQKNILKLFCFSR